MNKSLFFKIIILVLCLIFIFAILILGYKSQNKITSKITRQTSQEVYLLPNTFYDTNPYKSSVYASNSIKNIIIHFNYNLTSKTKLPKKYNYTLLTKIEAYQASDSLQNIIWTKTFLNEEFSSSLTNNELNLSKDIDLDYNYYNNLVKEYENTYNLKLTATLKVQLLITFNDFTDTIDLAIPLTSTITSINKLYEPLTITKKEFSFYPYLALIVIPVLLILVIKLPSKFKDNHLNHLLKTYQEYIIPTSKEPPLTNHSLIYLSKFEDLISVALTNNTHILSFNETSFYCFINNYIYCYILK